MGCLSKRSYARARVAALCWLTGKVATHGREVFRYDLYARGGLICSYATAR
jgi:hypothetical protein